MLLTCVGRPSLDSPGHARTGGAREPGQRVRRAGLRGARAARPRGAADRRPATRSSGCWRGDAVDIVHVHDPFAPSVSSAALRHSFSLNVATFHAPQERVLSTQVARPLVEIFFGRLDARTVTTRGDGASCWSATSRPLRAGRAGAASERDWARGRRRAGSDLPAAAGPPPRPRRRPGGAPRGSSSGR